MQLFIIALVGLLTGVLINHIADTLPEHEGFKIWQAPQCRQCGSQLGGLERFALLGFLLSRGRCRNCGASLSLRGPLVELASAAAFGFLWVQYGWRPWFVLTAVYTALFLLVLVIDLEHRLILNVVILPATLLAILASPFAPFKTTYALLGGLVAYFIVFCIYEFAHVFARLRRHAIAVPFGFGDVKLAGFMGLITGFPAVFNAILLAILLGGAGAILFLLYQAIAHRRLALGAAIPYGPFFCIAGWTFMILA
jgi:leader peptidase (prepilin peptidase)/N-methyltransferase